MPSCWRAAAPGLKEGEKGRHCRGSHCQTADQPGKVKGSRPRETTVMMMSREISSTRLLICISDPPNCPAPAGRAAAASPPGHNPTLPPPAPAAAPGHAPRARAPPFTSSARSAGRSPRQILEENLQLRTDKSFRRQGGGGGKWREGVVEAGYACAWLLSGRLARAGRQAAGSRHLAAACSWACFLGLRSEPRQAGSRGYTDRLGSPRLGWGVCSLWPHPAVMLGICAMAMGLGGGVGFGAKCNLTALNKQTSSSC